MQNTAYSYIAYSDSEELYILPTYCAVLPSILAVSIKYSHISNIRGHCFENKKKKLHEYLCLFYPEKKEAAGYSERVYTGLPSYTVYYLKAEHSNVQV